MARAGGLALPTITEDRALGDAKIQRSFRFDSASSTHLERTFGTNSSDTTKTLSFWMKRGNMSSYQIPFGTTVAGYIEGYIRINNDDTLQFEDRDASGGSSDGRRITSTKLRDASGWYHIVLALDSTQGTEADRAKIYINGTQATISSSQTIDQNYSFQFFRSSVINKIGVNGNDQYFFDGYLAEVHFVDGYQYDSSYFGFTDPQTGIWMPRRYEGTYGNNGFYLDFSDNSSITNMMIDKSPNGNDWLPDNCNTEDSMLDTPSNNFCVLRPYAKPVAGASLSEGNLKFSTGSTGDGGNLNRACMNTMIPSSGKWYMEVHASSGNYAFIGVHPFQTELTQGQQQSRWMGLYNYNGDKYVAKASSSASSSTYASSYGADILGIFIDMDASTPVVYFSKNGQWANGSGSWNQSNPYTSGGAIELGDTFFSEGNGGHRGVGVLIRSAFSNAGITANVNFGQDSTFAGRTTAGGNKDGHGIGDFKYPVPTNALAICAKNLPLTIEPSVLRPRKHFDIIKYTGNGATQSITGLEFAPDFVWVKERDSTSNHTLGDTVRGANKVLESNDQDAENEPDAGAHRFKSFDSNGFTHENSGAVNQSGQTYVAWCWRAGGNSNTYNIDGKGYATAAAAGLDGGTIDPTGASISTKCGFSIITYNGNGTAGATIAHGLGIKPAWIICKSRSNSSDWRVYHQTLGNTSALKLNTTDQAASSTNYWNDTSPTSTTVSFGTETDLNGSGRTHVMYCWAEIPGYSKFGKYKGSGDAEGKHVYCGFRPAWVMIKKVSSSGTSWAIQDTTRDTINPTAYNTLAADSNSAEPQSGAGTFEGNFIDFVSDGFVLKSNAGTTNAENQSHVYMAFAEQPGTTAFATHSNAR